MLIDDVVAQSQVVLNANHDLITRLAAERKRFEDWLHLEIFKALMNQEVELRIEATYPDSKERCDFWCLEQSGVESWVELKLCVTNYANDFAEAVSSRPITDQIADALRDIEKLKRLPSRAQRAVFLLAYPMPSNYQSHSAWRGHVSHIRSSAGSTEEKFSVPLHRKDKSAAVVGYRITL
jgi:hypothetical protein